MGSRGNWTLGRRPALDGLRGVAILLVLLAHTGAPWFSLTGAIGVTLFFVLSGFLITGLLLEERSTTGRVDFRRFYIRRARRLAPALVAVTAGIAGAGLLLGDWWFQWRHLLPVLLYVGNWVEARPGPNDLGALGITWSLAIEEQFYLLWPLAVAVLARRRWVTFAAALMSLVSVLWRLILISNGADLERLYYGSDTVAFALLLGGCVLGFRMRGGAGRSSWALLAIAAAVGAFCATWTLQLFMTLGIPIVGVAAGLALWATTGAATLPGLSAAWLRWFGSRSYGIYLIHGPILWAMRDHFGQPWWLVALTGLPASLLLAEASYRWLETPFRTRRSATAPNREAVFTRT